MKAHAVTVDTETVPVMVYSVNTSGYRYRWRCTCGSVGEWKLKAHSARNGGARHVAMMERSRPVR